MIGSDNIRRLAEARVLVVGLGGVGSFAAEFLARAGVGNMTIIDGDIVEATNRNRQLPALVSTDGMLKTAVMENRIRDINPDIQLTAISEFVTGEFCDELFAHSRFDYVVDAIDTLAPKINLIAKAKEHHMKVVSSMGAGGRVDPTQVEIKDISKVYNCRLAIHVKKRLRQRSVRYGVKAIFSPEPTLNRRVALVEGRNKKSYLGTISYIPALFGICAASVVIRGLINPDELEAGSQEGGEE